MTELNDAIAALLPGWTGIIIQQDAAGVLICGRYHDKLHIGHSGISPADPNDPLEYAAYLHGIAVREHAVTHSKDSLEAAADELRKLESRYVPAKEAIDARPILNGNAAASGAGSGLPGDPSREPLAPPVSAAPAEYVAVEVEQDAPADPALDAEVTDAASAGMMIERDEIARLIKELAVAISYRREDLLEGVSKRIGEILEAQVAYFNTPVHEDSDVTRFNAEQSEHAALLLRKAAIERFADDARKGLEGKTLAYLQTIDVAAMAWPT